MSQTELVNYELHDISSGGVYSIKVTQKEAAALNLDKEKRYRLLKYVKQCKEPDMVWDSLIQQSPPSKPTGRSVPSKKMKVSVGQWNDAGQWALLSELVPYGRQLRTLRYGCKIWEEVSVKLLSYDLPEKYNADQVAEKVRLMKRTLTTVNNGGRKTKWDFTEMMKYVFEDPIEDTDEGPPQCSFSVGSYNSYVNGVPTGAHSSTTENSPATAEQGSCATGDTLVVCSEEALSFGNDCNDFGDGDGDCMVDKVHLLSASTEEENIQNDGVVAGLEPTGDTLAVFSEEDLSCGNEYGVNDKVEVITLSDSEEARCVSSTVVKRELFDRNLNDVGDEISYLILDDVDSLSAFPAAAMVDQEHHLSASTEMEDIAATIKKKANKSIGPCRMTPKGRSPWKSPRKSPRGEVALQGSSLPATPVKKKSKSTVGCIVTPASPAKTSKRKPAQKNLVWATNVTEYFITECVTRKTAVQQFPNVPVTVWKDLAAALNRKGHIDITWDLCRAKFDQMNNFFVTTALKLGGVIGTTKWTHYNNFLTIHDIPADAEIPSDSNFDQNNNNINNNNDGGGRKILWTDRNVTLLLDCYKIMKEKFSGTKSGVRHTILYAHIAGIMNQFEDVQNISGKQCESHMNLMRTKFFEEYDGSRGTGCAPSKWPFFKTMREIFIGDANLDAPFVASVGDGRLSYTVRGNEEAPSERNTRTRPPSATVPAKGPSKCKPPRKTYKSWTQEVQEKQVEQRQALVDEVRLLRLNFEVRSAQRMEMLKNILQKL